MDALKGLLSSKINQKTTLSRQMKSGLVIEFVNEKIRDWWGNEANKQIKAISFKNSTLRIDCSQPVFAQEMNFKQNKLIFMINNKFQSNLVKKIKIVQNIIEKEQF